MSDKQNSEKSGGLLDFLQESGQTLSNAQHKAQYDLACIAFGDFEKLLKNVALYGLEHQSTQSFVDRTHKALVAACTEHGQLDITVRPYELTVHGHVVFENASPERNFIYTLYLDGVRRLSFLSSFTADEFRRFISILVVDWDQPSLFEDDMVTLLWSEHFQGLTYSVIDNYAEDITDEDNAEYTVSNVIERVRTRGQFLLDTGLTSADGASRRLQRVDMGGVSISNADLEAFSEVVFDMDRAEYRRLQRTLHTTAREKLEKFIEILFKVHLIQEISEEARRGRITELFDRIADLLLDNGAIGELERLLRTIRRLTGPEEQLIRENVLAIEHIVDHWSAQPFIDRITLGLRDPSFRYRPSVIGICHLLSRRAAPHIARVAGRLSDQDTRALLWALVAEKINGQEHAVADLLSSAGRQHAHELFALLKSHTNTEELKYAIEVALDNPDPKVRLEALTNLPSQDIENYQSMLRKMLSDGSKPVRSRALHLLARCRSDELHKHILSQIADKEFAKYGLDEKRRFFATAALTGGEPSYWVDLFKANALLSTKGQDAVRHCAAVAIGIIGHAEGFALLEKEAKRRLKYPLAAEGAVWAIQHMRCGREERTRQLYALFYSGELASMKGSSNV
ncbi:MAG: hypothetical protein ACON3Z_03090 [Bradymonadia bacterium]